MGSSHLVVEARQVPTANDRLGNLVVMRWLEKTTSHQNIELPRQISYVKCSSQDRAHILAAPGILAFL